jgi:O-antigen/teichoic acid export membrane protein
MNIKSRLRQILAVGSVESLGVIVGGIAGLLIVNVLPKDQYAQYTFLITCTTLMLGITDMGLSHCCLPVVGQRASEVPWVVAACNQVFRKRWWLLLLGSAITAPYWLTTALQHDWMMPSYWAASIFSVAVVLLTLPTAYGSTVLMILGHISAMNRVGFYSLGVRLLLVAGVLLLPITAYSLAGVIAATAVAGAISVMLYRRTFRNAGVVPSWLKGEEARRVDAEIYRIAKPVVLPAIFYQVQGSVTVFIVSLFGSAAMLAEVGALGRISMVLLVFDRVAAILLFPAIARAPDGDRLVALVAKAHLAYVGLMALIFVTALLWPQYWILLLGEHYKNQQSLLWMVFLATLLMNCAQFAFVTLSARGHTRRQTFVVPFVLSLQVLCLWTFGVADLRAILAFGIATSLGHFLYQYAMLGVWFAGRDQRKAAA